MDVWRMDGGWMDIYIYRPIGLSIDSILDSMLLNILSIASFMLQLKAGPPPAGGGEPGPPRGKHSIA